MGKDANIYFICPDDNKPIGGIKQLYRHVDILNENGFSAFILHGRKGFRCTWFKNSTKVAYNFNAAKRVLISSFEKMVKEVSSDPLSNFFHKTARLSSSDYIVIPEIYGLNISRIGKGMKKVIFNQNAHCTFSGYPISQKEVDSPYLSSDVMATIVVSDHSFDYLRYVFPGINIFRIHNGIDSALFRYSHDKKKQISFMPRKLPEQIRQVINILKFRGVISDFELVSIGDKSEQEIADILRESLIFLSFSTQEGCGLPPMEAMACGCAVIGYDGIGGKEYFNQEFCYPVAAEDILGFAKTVEAAVKEYGHDKERFLDKGKKASEFILKNYSLQKEREDVVLFWRHIIDGKPIRSLK